MYKMMASLPPNKTGPRARIDIPALIAAKSIIGFIHNNIFGRFIRIFLVVLHVSNTVYDYLIWVACSLDLVSLTHPICQRVHVMSCDIVILAYSAGPDNAPDPILI